MIGDTVYVRDDNGKKHAATVVGKTQVLGPFHRYRLIVDSTGQELFLFPEHFTNS